KQARLGSSRSPAQFAERGGIGIVFQSRRDSKFPRQNLYRIAALPSRQIIHVAEDAGGAVERTGATDPNPSQLGPGLFRTLMKQRRHLLHGVIEAALCLRGALVLSQDTARLVDHSHRDLGAANVNPADHFASRPSSSGQNSV